MTNLAATVVLTFPNETQVTTEGDGEIVKQLVDRLDGIIIGYHQERSIDA